MDGGTVVEGFPAVSSSRLFVQYSVAIFRLDIRSGEMIV
jgi:hypothetical protein